MLRVARGRRLAVLALSSVLVIAVVGGAGFYLKDLRRQVGDLERRVDVLELEPRVDGGIGGSFVALMRSNPIVTPGVETELVRLTLPPGGYQVFGKVGLHNRGGAPFDTSCGLVPSNKDGTPGDPGAAEADAGFLNLAPTGSPGDKGEFPLSVSQELDAPGTVVLFCRGTEPGLGAFASYGSIRAIEVGSIESRTVTP